MSQNDGWSERWAELVDDLERQREALHCEQERWAEWHAVQEEALLEQVRLLEQKEQDLYAREQVLADTLRALEEDAMLLDERHHLLRQERKLFQEEIKKHKHALQQARYQERAARSGPRVVHSSRNHYHTDEPSGDFVYSDHPPSQMSDEDISEENYRNPRTQYMREPMPQPRYTHYPKTKVAHRQITSPIRDGRDYNYSRTPPSAPPMSDVLGAFEVRVNSPDNTRVHVTYRDPPPNIEALYNQRRSVPDAAEYAREQAQLRRAAEAEKWQSLPPPPPRVTDQRAELTTGNSGYSKVNAGIQASETIRSKVKALRESVVPNCGGISEQSSNSGHGVLGSGGDLASDRQPAIKIADIVRTAKPPTSSSNASRAQSGSRIQPPAAPGSRSSSIEFKLKNLVDKLDR